MLAGGLPSAIAAGIASRTNKQGFADLYFAVMAHEVVSLL
jgi:hypothetical protein